MYSQQDRNTNIQQTIFNTPSISSNTAAYGYSNQNYGQHSYDGRFNSYDTMSKPYGSSYDSYKNTRRYDQLSEPTLFEEESSHMGLPKRTSNYYNNNAPTSTDNNYYATILRYKPSYKEQSMDSFNQRSNWIMVFGVPKDRQPEVLRLFDNTGHIITYIPGKGNQLFIQYASEYEADKAIQYNGKYICQDIIIGVHSITENEVKGRGIHIEHNENTIDDAIEMNRRRNINRFETHNDIQQPKMMNSIPKKRESFCDYIMKWIFNY
ncbi:hypothetical protein WA158_001629 [Blastocystis sp. Blastoise]